MSDERVLSYSQAISEGQQEEMRRDPRVFLMGNDAQTKLYGSGGEAEFGFERVRNTPISESGFTGAGIGAAMVGMRPIVNLSIASFIYPATNQIVSMAAKSQYLFGGQTTIPLVIRCQMNYNAGLAAQHSDRPYPMFMGVPGLKIVTPATPYDAKGLIKAAIRDDNPVIVFEDTTLSGTKGPVPEDDYVVPLGVADVKREGTDVTIVAVAGSVRHALAAAEMVEADGMSAEVVDPRTVAPLDGDTILESVAKTGRLVIVDPAVRTCSAASEIAALVAEKGFWDLRAPIERVTAPDVHPPFSRPLERGIYPDPDRIAAAVKQTFA